MSRLRHIIAEHAYDGGHGTLDGRQYDEMIGNIEQALIEESGGPEHVVRITDGIYTVQHPLPERFEGDLFTCQIADAVGLFMAGEEDGQYVVRQNGDVLEWEVVDGGEE